MAVTLPMYGYIYRTINLINGKQYIGKHKSCEFDPNYKGSGKIIREAYDKYGWDNFQVEMLCPCFSRNELNSEEVFIIDYLDAVSSNRYYNIAKGGDGGDVTGGNHELHSRRTKLGMKRNNASTKISQSKAGMKLPLEHAAKLAQGAKRYWSNPTIKAKRKLALLGNTYASHPQSDEQKAKASEFHSTYQNSDEAKLAIAVGRGREMLKEFIRLDLPYDTPSDWDNNRYQIDYGRKYKSSYFLRFFDDWTLFINNMKERM